MERFCKKLHRFLKTLIITQVFGLIWMILELLIYGVITNRLVDNIMLCVFTVIVYGLQKGE
jgi:hypothetical protein